ncbi:MAG: hypothetical protein H6741_19780 [Alphaproteobacteria bacterium]|nr:hypothetical protein [Alphaproteobacteria bacterium]MCB9794946.1 hypothetical protein [Alphaproteobacteria bacterium]
MRPGAPRVRRGALATYALPMGAPQVVSFQYNPHSMTRTLQVRGAEERGAAETGRIAAPPVEMISLTASLSALSADAPTRRLGVHAQLAALEVLAYPPSTQVLLNHALAASGSMQVLPPQDRLTLFAWGDPRVVPVALTELSVEETQYDADLNPVYAEVRLGLRVLTYAELGVRHPGHALFLAHQVLKEQLAQAGALRSGGAR